MGSDISLPKEELSYWHGTSTSPDYHRLEDDIQTDAVVIGGGILGLTTAYLLKNSGLKVVVLEKDTLGAGSTGKTTGKVTSQHNLIYEKLLRQHGQKMATIYGEANEQAIRRIKEIITKEKIACDWQDDDNYVYTADPDQVEKFKKEAEAAQACGMSATFVDECPLPFAITAAVKFSGQAKFHARKYVLGLARTVNGDGSYIFEHTRAIGIRDGDPGAVSTPHGEIRAKNIIVATKVPTFPLLARLGYGFLEYPQFSYVVAGKLQNQLTGMYISPDKNHYSILPFNSGEDHYLFVGGQNHIPGTRLNFKVRHRRLAEYAAEHFGIEAIDYRWKAWDYLGYDDMPLAGKVYPWSRSLYTGTGFMKWGLTNTMVCALILHDKVTGKKNPWAQTFNTMRMSPIASIPKVVAEKIR